MVGETYYAVTVGQPIMISYSLAGAAQDLQSSFQGFSGGETLLHPIGGTQL
ncbi:MAG: hypothetical protein ACP5UO_05925 [Thermoplasmata archaeon]